MISAVPSVSSVHVELDGRLPSTAGRTDVTTKGKTKSECVNFFFIPTFNVSNKFMNFSYSQPCCVCPDSSSLTTSLSSSKRSHRNRFESPGLGLVTSHTYLNMTTTYTIVSSWNPPKSEVSPGNTRYFTLLLGLTLDSS